MPSDRAPHGASGKRVLMPVAAARAMLGSLTGMGVNIGNASGHNPGTKVGVIQAARIEGDAIMVSGHLGAADFPAEIRRIRSDLARLGMSFEGQFQFESANTDPLVIAGGAFHGACILPSAEAAYGSTRLAAAADKGKQMDPVLIDPPLLREMTKRGIETAGSADGKRLSQAQLEELLRDREPGDRIRLRMLVAHNGIHPLSAA